MLLALGVGSNLWILGGQLDGMEKRTTEKFESLGGRFKTVEDGIKNVAKNVKELTKRQTDMEAYNMQAVQKLLQDCRRGR